MTSLTITHGCGHITVVTAEGRGENEPICIAIRSDCEAVEKMSGEITVLNRMDVFLKYGQNPVFRVASKYLKHVTCPVPVGILMALEVEADFNVPRRTMIEFTEDGPDGSLKG